VVRFIGESVCGKNASVAVHLYLHSSVKLKITSETGEEEKKRELKIMYKLLACEHLQCVCVCVFVCRRVSVFTSLAIVSTLVVSTV